MAKKNTFNFDELIQKDFDVKEDDASKSTSNFLTPSVDDNQSIVKKIKKSKEYQYKKIFDHSLSDLKDIKKSAQIYQYNMDKINLLSSLNKGVNLTEIINYIINDFFIKNSDEIKEENKLYSIELNKNL